MSKIIQYTHAIYNNPFVLTQLILSFIRIIKENIMIYCYPI